MLSNFFYNTAMEFERDADEMLALAKEGCEAGVDQESIKECLDRAQELMDLAVEYMRMACTQLVEEGR